MFSLTLATHSRWTPNELAALAVKEKAIDPAKKNELAARIADSFGIAVTAKLGTSAQASRDVPFTGLQPPSALPLADAPVLVPPFPELPAVLAQEAALLSDVLPSGPKLGFKERDLLLLKLGTSVTADAAIACLESAIGKIGREHRDALLEAIPAPLRKEVHQAILAHPALLADLSRMDSIDLGVGGQTVSSWATLASHQLRCLPGFMPTDQVSSTKTEQTVPPLAQAELGALLAAHPQFQDLTPRIQGRTLVFEDPKTGECLCVKVQKRGEPIEEMQAEPLMQKTLAALSDGLGLRSRFPTPVGFGLLDLSSKAAVVDTVPGKADADEGKYNCFVYRCPTEYLSYLTDARKTSGVGGVGGNATPADLRALAANPKQAWPVTIQIADAAKTLATPSEARAAARALEATPLSGPERLALGKAEAFQRGMDDCMHDLFALAKNGWIFTQLVDMYHSPASMADRAFDGGGRYLMLLDLLRDVNIGIIARGGAGKINDVVGSVRWANVRPTGLADVGDSMALAPIVGAVGHLAALYGAVLKPLKDDAPNVWDFTSKLGAAPANDALLAKVRATLEAKKQQGLLDRLPPTLSDDPLTLKAQLAELAAVTGELADKLRMSAKPSDALPDLRFFAALAVFAVDNPSSYAAITALRQGTGEVRLADVAHLSSAAQRCVETGMPVPAVVLSAYLGEYMISHLLLATGYFTSEPVLRDALVDELLFQGGVGPTLKAFEASMLQSTAFAMCGFLGKDPDTELEATKAYVAKLADFGALAKQVAFFRTDAFAMVAANDTTSAAPLKGLKADALNYLAKATTVEALLLDKAAWTPELSDAVRDQCAKLAKEPWRWDTAMREADSDGLRATLIEKRVLGGLLTAVKQSTGPTGADGLLAATVQKLGLFSGAKATLSFPKLEDTARNSHWERAQVLRDLEANPAWETFRNAVTGKKGPELEAALTPLVKSEDPDMKRLMARAEAAERGGSLVGTLTEIASWLTMPELFDERMGSGYGVDLGVINGQMPIKELEQLAYRMIPAMLLKASV